MNFETISDPEKNESINYINFNQDFSCFMVGTNNGYKIFNTIPLIELKNFESKNITKDSSASSSTDSLNNNNNNNNIKSNNSSSIGFSNNNNNNSNNYNNDNNNNSYSLK
eukprot:jgi/Orpsp1_1/1177063/evm.model.c7180000060055.1